MLKGCKIRAIVSEEPLMKGIVAVVTGVRCVWRSLCWVGCFL